ncbi:uncharacterized membrane protein (DUF485 family) [Bacillus ectoiniformans]|nr:DUF485 domain-containing protein [Bacillus ectoiniformans]MBM7650128.1 uncharacterized membrane protein (DUF485 family) [Bacillus ectoiniformans]
MDNRILKADSPKKKAIDYEEIAASADFQSLVKKKNSFLLPMSLFFLAFYFSLPLMTSYSKVLNTPAIGAISWVWIFALAQFIMTWTLCMMYVKKANKFDEMAEEIIKDYQTDDEGEKSL